MIGSSSSFEIGAWLMKLCIGKGKWIIMFHKQASGAHVTTYFVSYIRYKYHACIQVLIIWNIILEPGNEIEFLLKYASVQPPDQGPLYIYVEGIFFSSSCSEIPEYQFKDPSKHFLKSLAKVFAKCFESQTKCNLGLKFFY